MSHAKSHFQNRTEAHSRQIAWNGLQLSLPSKWDVIVSAPRHLLIEQDFKPVVEIRWELDGPATVEHVVKSLRKSADKSSRDTIGKIPLPKEFSALATKRGASGLSWNSEASLNCLLWTCKNTNATIICRLFDACKVSTSRIIDLLLTITFQKSETTSQLWSVQDFKLSVPSSFQFVDYTFAPGLTRLAFQNRNMNLQICRLAPALERLASHPLKSILAALQGDVDAGEVIQDEPMLLETCSYPTLIQQLRMRLKRNKPFQWGRIWHVEEHNRILALTAESIRPFELDTVHEICSQYEII